MNIFFWKNNKSIDQFANDIATSFYEKINPQQVAAYIEGSSQKKSKQDKKALKAVEKAIQQAITGISEFKSSKSLGVYGKARLHLKFKLRLVELGIEEVSVNKINEIIMVKTP